MRGQHFNEGVEPDLKGMVRAYRYVKLGDFRGKHAKGLPERLLCQFGSMVGSRHLLLASGSRRRSDFLRCWSARPPETWESCPEVPCQRQHFQHAFRHRRGPEPLEAGSGFGEKCSAPCRPSQTVRNQHKACEKQKQPEQGLTVSDTPTTGQKRIPTVQVTGS